MVQPLPSLQWDGASRWTAFSGMISGFALIATLQSSNVIQSGQQSRSAKQTRFLKSLEDQLFEVFDIEKTTVRVRNALPLNSELKMFCDSYPVTPDTLVPMRMLLGIVFPNRSSRYQSDWAAGLVSAGPHAPAEFAAMRLAADLTGIETPASLQGRNVKELGIDCYASALEPLFSFAIKYINMTA